MEPGLDRVVAPGDRGDRQPDPRADLLDPTAVAGRDQHTLDRVAVDRGDLTDLGTERPSRLVRLAYPVGLPFGRDLGGVHQRRVRHRRLERPEIDDLAGSAVADRGGGGLGRVQERFAIEAVRVGVAERRAVPNPNPGAPVEAGRHLLDLAVVQAHRGAETLLHVQLRERTATGARGPKDLCCKIAVEHGGMLTAAGRRTGP